MRQYTIAALMLCLSAGMFAQGAGDIQRYTTHQPPGTARFGAMGGAFTALGGDMSSITINPAGIGVFRFAEISLSPSVEMRDIRTSLAGESSTGSHSGLAVNNLGFILVNEVDDPFWKSVNVGVTVNRMNTYNDQIVTGGVLELGNTLMQSWVDQADGIAPDNLPITDAGLAYDAFVIDDIEGSVPTRYVGGVQQGLMSQRHTVNTTGRMNDIGLTVGGNYDDKFYIGGGLGILTSYYDVELETTEEATLPGSGDLRRYTFRENMNVEGVGFNLRAGFIYRITKQFRVGGSVQTPTTFRMQDNYGQGINAIRDGLDPNSISPDTDFIEYRVRTPWRYTFGVAGVIKGKAILTGQYEFVNFRGAEYRPANRRSGLASFLDNANFEMQEFYRAQHAFRGGVEFRMTPKVMARGGAAFFPNVVPISEGAISGRMDQVMVGGGLGYRERAWNLDLSYSVMRFHEPYRVSGAGSTQELQNTLGVLTLTFGYRI